MSRHLHIVTHDVPWPVDYGGVVDLFYKIKALHSFGIKIHLHCFTSGRSPQHNLEKYCASVAYYDRTEGVAGFSLSTPYIVSSRKDKQLLIALQQDNFPVLLEGIHCTWLLHSGQLPHRKVFVRLHNVESNYYKQLSRHEANFMKRLYFLNESRLLRSYERALARKGIFWAVSKTDEKYYKDEFGADHIQTLPVFLPWQEVSSHEGQGSFCLYHGNLSVNENEKAATWLLTEVFGGIDLPLVIAGKDPSAKLEALAKKNSNTCIIANPSESEMQDLLTKAQLNVLPAFNNTGVKLKMLNALYNGRHCLVNTAGVAGSGVEEACSIADSLDEFRTEAQRLFKLPFTASMIKERASLLETTYDWQKNTKKLIAWIY